MDLILKKIPQNQLCPCGSSKKFENCHGIDGNLYWPPSSVLEEIRKREIKEQLRKRNEGLGRSMISIRFEEQDLSVIAIGNQIMWGKWKTDHDFLLDYIRHVLGAAWWNLELKKPQEERHIILQWCQKVCEYQSQTIKNPNEVATAPMIGAVDAYMNLSYNLYLLQHNEELQQHLINRLKNSEQFPGAYYETYVFSWFIKAGFQIEFENELDRSKSHVECVAIDRQTGNKYCIEAKCINRPKAYGAKKSTTVKSIEQSAIDQVKKALKKEAAYERLVFVNLNLSREEAENIIWLQKISTMVKNNEKHLKFDNVPAPKAYLFFTNNPHHYHLEDKNYNHLLAAMGFKIPDFGDIKNLTPEQSITLRQKHASIFRLMESIISHHQIPTSFVKN